MKVRRLLFIAGDQLDHQSAVFDGADPAADAVCIAEVASESTKVWSSKPRTAIFLSAMRHFRDELRARGWRVFYRQLTAEGGEWHSSSSASRPSPAETLEDALSECARQTRPEQIIAVEPGEWAVREWLLRFPGVELREDRHFLCPLDDFRRHAAGRKQLRMEFFYREMRQRHDVLMENGKPAGGAWNFDSENRKSFGREGPPLHRAPCRFPPDALTQEVIRVVNARFPDHPGDLAAFDWPVTAAEAEAALNDFIMHRLPEFGDWQDAMWPGEPWLFHSRLSAAMNLKLLDPRRVIAAAEQAWRTGRAPLPAVEGLIRQILGWREYVRGIYWLHMPEYVRMNALKATQPLPAFYWTGETDMQCLRDALGQTLRYGYAHHIQRLMVTGLYALLLGVDPHEVHLWYLAVYVDAVEWVELPNTLGMSQFGDGGLMASKPYVATGKYIQRMSGYCTGCRYDPAVSTGPKACPFTTLYWDFLDRHETVLRRNPRMGMQMKNLDRLTEEQRGQIRAAADKWRAQS